jgi:hypothetical protein
MSNPDSVLDALLNALVTAVEARVRQQIACKLESVAHEDTGSYEAPPRTVRVIAADIRNGAI